MKYTQPHPTDIRGDWQVSIANGRLNYEHLKEINRVAKEEGTLLHRSFSLQVADGKVHYQITKLKKKSVVVELCLGICPDEYQDSILGEKSEISLSKAQELIGREDALARLFDGRPNARL